MTPAHLNIQTTKAGLTNDVILDGDIIEESLNNAGVDKSWLQSELSKQGINNAAEVFYAGVDSSKNLYVSRKKIVVKEEEEEYDVD